MKINESSIFSCFYVLVFSLSYIFQGRKNATFFEIMSAASYSSVIWTLKKYQKDRLELNFLDFGTHFSAKIRLQNSIQSFVRMVFSRGELFR